MTLHKCRRRFYSTFFTILWISCVLKFVEISGSYDKKFCNTRKSGVYPDPDDCQSRYVCWFKYEHHVTCSNKKAYDPVKRRCTEEYMATCMGAIGHETSTPQRGSDKITKFHAVSDMPINTEALTHGSRSRIDCARMCSRDDDCIGFALKEPYTVHDTLDCVMYNLDALGDSNNSSTSTVYIKSS